MSQSGMSDFQYGFDTLDRVVEPLAYVGIHVFKHGIPGLGGF